jgi:hypothetical protein
MEEPTDPQQPRIVPDHVFDYVTLLYEQGKKEPEVLNRLEEQGYDRQTGMLIIMESSRRQVAAAREHKDNNSGGCFVMIVGALLIAVGVGVTAFTYKNSFAGSYILFYGPIAFGVYFLIAGAVRWIKSMGS